MKVKFNHLVGFALLQLCTWPGLMNALNKFAMIAIPAGWLAAGSTSANARADCAKNIRAAILHVNGNVYFTTDKTCPNWCQASWGSSSNNKSALAMLLTE